MSAPLPPQLHVPMVPPAQVKLFAMKTIRDFAKQYNLIVVEDKETMRIIKE